MITAIETYRSCHLIYQRVTYALPLCAILLTISHREALQAKVIGSAGLPFCFPQGATGTVYL
jgi:hypothetical protein